jgi:hypothetical protein
MSPRRQGSEETLLGNHDKLDGSLSFFFLTYGESSSMIQDVLRDPFLVVQPSLNDSMLVKQGLVEETALPLPVHSAHDIQVGPLFRALPCWKP